MSENDYLLKIRKYVDNCVCKNDISHDFSHICRVLHIAQKLAVEIPQANSELVMLLAYLHEACDKKLNSYAKFSDLEEFLHLNAVPCSYISFLIKYLPYISYSHYPCICDALPIEVQIVRDADRIDAIGALGIARTFAYTGSRGNKLYSTDPFEDTTLRHFEKKLLLLYDRLDTPEAKIFAKSRNDFLKQFYDKFIEEIGDSI